MAADDVNQYLTDLAGGSSTPPEEDNEATVENAITEAALLETMAHCGSSDRVLLHLRPLSDDWGGHMGSLASAYTKLLDRHYGFVCDYAFTSEEVPTTGRQCVADDKDPILSRICSCSSFRRRNASWEARSGPHLFMPSGAKMGIIQVMMIPLSAEDDPLTVAGRTWKPMSVRARKWPRGTQLFLVTPGYCARRASLRRQSCDRGSGNGVGFQRRGVPLTPNDLRTFILARLPLPQEIGVRPEI